MNLQEKMIAQTYFKLKIYQKDGYEFQNLFTEIMNKYDEKFMTIKTQGNIGDRKNDGYNYEKGIYYQVYAPEKIDYREAISKIDRDIEGLHKYWNEICPIKQYKFVINDKYYGGYPTINAKILEVGKKYNIDASIMLSKDLENILFQLKDEEIIGILGNVIASPMAELSFSSLNDVIDGIMNLPLKETEKLTLPAQIDDKIKFNNLNSEVGNILNQYSIYTGQLEEYFTNKGDFEREKVQQILAQIYDESKTKIDETIDDSSSIRFFYILDKLKPDNASVSVINAIYILMSYYFESCDIFLNPNDKEI